jgi:hypothetical protein
MEKKIHLLFTYIIEGHVAAGNIDTYFYSHLPNVETQVVDMNTGRPVTDIPPIEQTITVTGSTFVSPATIAVIIRDYLQSRSRKIKLSVVGTNKHIEYEGPNLMADAAEIEATINRLASEGGEDDIEITSTC